MDRKGHQRLGRGPHVQGTASFSKFMNVLQAIADDPQARHGKAGEAASLSQGTLYRIVTA